MGFARFIPSRLRDVLDPFRDLTFNVMAYGAVGDGSTDDTAAIQAAIAAAALVGGIVYFPEGAYKITSTLTVTGRVTFRGAGMRQYLFSNAVVTTGARVLWYGSAGGTMVDVCPAAGAAEAVVGFAIEGLALRGRATSTSTGAGIGIRYRASTQCQMRNVFIDECTVAAIKTDWNSDGTYTGLNYVYSCVFESVWIYQNLSGGDGLYLSGKGSGAGNDTSFCTFRHLHITYNNGNGITINEADSNSFYMIGMSGGPTLGGTGVGVRFKASSAVGHGAISNAFFSLWPGQGGVYAEGTPTAVSPSTKNAIYGYSDQDAPPDPVVEAGAGLLVVKLSGNNLMYGGSDSSIADGSSIAHYYDSYGSGIQSLIGRHARGSVAAPRRVKAADTIMNVAAVGFNAVDDSTTAIVDATSSAAIQLSASEDHTPTAQGTFIAFRTNAVGATSAAERFRIVDGGVDLRGLKAANSAAATANGDLVRYEQAVKSGDAAGGDLSGTFPSPSIAASAVTLAKLAAALTLDAIATGRPTAADIDFNSKKAKNLAAGTARTDGVNVGQRVDPLAAALGYINWNYNPAFLLNASNPTSQLVYLCAIWLPPGLNITNVVLNASQGSSGTNPTGFFVGLAGPTGTMLAQSNNLNGQVFTLGPNSCPLNATYTTSASDSANGIYYAVVLQNGAWGTTTPTFGRMALGAWAAAPLGANPQPFGTGATTGRTTLPANGSGIAGGISTANPIAFCVGVI